ncbi:response regulator transcription factor [Adlercreutzia muris]|uniref:response regulator transcription factor n=1 Tax=Adlercreutzia muris TaxID=1796610 RepID=UPI001F562554|nr:helix-turn-helix transcriptional regulator [Adlercreutzia muris]
MGFCYVHLIMWGLYSYLTKSFALPAPWVVAWPTCCLMAGQLIGGGAAVALVQQPDALAWTTTLALLARGRNRRYISEELVVSEKLVVSEETVKSHVSSIYAKLGVHTQQELLDVVEVSVAALRDGAGPTPFA